jgi:hypothetical protein
MTEVQLLIGAVVTLPPGAPQPLSGNMRFQASR